MSLVSRRELIGAGSLALATTFGRAANGRLVVSKDRGAYRDVQRAIDAVPSGNAQTATIEVGRGMYAERLTIPRDKRCIRLIGERAADTVITYNLSTATTAETRYSASAYVFADDFQAENITFENSHGPGSQAVALFVGADRCVFRNCRFLGWQDTLYVNGPGCHFVPQPLAATDAANCPPGRHYFDGCYIEGHVDFIFGNASAVFRNCEIHSKGAGYVTAQSKTYREQNSGFVFDSCRLTGESTGAGVYLGRPWRAFSQVTYLDCWLGEHIRPEGWSVWNGNNNHETSSYAEFRSQGPGANPGRRVSWSHQLTTDQAKQFDVRTVLKGSDGWAPVP
jgi:pectinesterase